MNNPLIFTDPSGYRPDLIFEEEEMMRRSGGGTGFNYFGWINKSMSSVGWTDYTGPTWNQMNYWYDNIKGNKAFGQHSENIGYWWRNGMPTSPTGKDLLDGANMFVNEGYIPGAADFLFVDRYGTSIELTTIFSFLDKRRLDYINSQALLEASMAEYTYGAYGMMMGDPEKGPWFPGIYDTSWKNLGYQARQLDENFRFGRPGSDRRITGQPPIIVKVIVSPILALPNSAITILTGNDIYGIEVSDAQRWVAAPISAALFLYPSQISTYVNIPEESVYILDPLINKALE